MNPILSSHKRSFHIILVSLFICRQSSSLCPLFGSFGPQEVYVNGKSEDDQIHLPSMMSSCPPSQYPTPVLPVKSVLHTVINHFIDTRSTPSKKHANCDWCLGRVHIFYLWHFVYSFVTVNINQQVIIHITLSHKL